MFKPHYGNCSCCGEPGLIVVKKGLRDSCNFKSKQSAKGSATNIMDTQDMEGYTNSFRAPIRKKKKVQRGGKRTSKTEIHAKTSFGKSSGLQGIKAEHTYVYMKAFDYTIADFVPCELCGLRCVDVHHIFARGMGGSDLEEELYNKIENLMGLCREEHTEYGDKKQFYDFLIQKHFEFLSNNGIKYDKNFFEKWQE